MVEVDSQNAGVGSSTQPYEWSEPRMNYREERAAALAESIARQQDLLRSLQNAPMEDIYEDGAVIRFRLRNTTMTLTYALLKVNEHWYYTGRIAGRTHHGPFSSWSTLMHWVIGGGHEIVEWTLMAPAMDHDVAPTTAAPTMDHDLRAGVKTPQAYADDEPPF